MAKLRTIKWNKMKWNELGIECVRSQIKDNTKRNGKRLRKEEIKWRRKKILEILSGNEKAFVEPTQKKKTTRQTGKMKLNGISVCELCGRWRLCVSLSLSLCLCSLPFKWTKNLLLWVFRAAPLNANTFYIQKHISTVFVLLLHVVFHILHSSCVQFTRCGGWLCAIYRYSFYYSSFSLKIVRLPYFPF